MEMKTESEKFMNKSIIERLNDTDPGELEDWYYEQWRDKQALASKLANNEIKLEA